MFTEDSQIRSIWSRLPAAAAEAAPTTGNRKRGESAQELQGLAALPLPEAEETHLQEKHPWEASHLPADAVPKATVPSRAPSSVLTGHTVGI